MVPRALVRVKSIRLRPRRHGTRRKKRERRTGARSQSGFWIVALRIVRFVLPPRRGGIFNFLGLPLEPLGHHNQMPARWAVQRQVARQSQILGRFSAKVSRTHSKVSPTVPINAEFTKQ